MSINGKVIVSSIYALRLPLQDEWTSSGAKEKILSFTDEFKGKVRMDGERSIALKNHMQQKGWKMMGKSKIALKALFLFIFAFLFLKRGRSSGEAPVA